MRQIKLAISSAFESPLIYRIVSYRIVSYWFLPPVLNLADYLHGLLKLIVLGHIA